MQTRSKTKSKPKFVFIASSHTDTNPQRFQLNKDGSVNIDEIEKQFQIQDSWFELFGKRGSLVPSGFLSPDKKYVICGKKKLKPISQTLSKTGIVYDERMMKHDSNEQHHERPERISKIWEYIQSEQLEKVCIRVDAREATMQELTLIHDEDYVKAVKYEGSEAFGNEEDQEEHPKLSWTADCYLNRYTAMSALLAAGSVVEVTEQVITGKLTNAFAIIRPPGHHALKDTAMGFCFFNNIAVAAMVAKTKYKLERILIVDWDVHHGNGTEEVLIEDPNILYFSTHRYGNQFFPKTGDINTVGIGKGAGKNVNVPFYGNKVGDAEILSIFYHILLPIALEFNPQLVLVSAGFDAVKGDPLGKLSVSPNGFAHLTHLLKTFANGKLVLALEGGYNIYETAKCVTACLRVLLGEAPPEVTSFVPCDKVKELIHDVKQVHSKYWKCFREFKKPKDKPKTNEGDELAKQLEEKLHIENKKEQSEH